MCCSDPVSYRPSPPLIRQPQATQPNGQNVFQPTSQQFQPLNQRQPQPQDQNRNQPQQFRQNQQPFRSQSNAQQPEQLTPNSIGKTCQDPNGVVGVCKSIKECPSVLSEFLVKNKDSAYVRYIKRSNENCRKIEPFICCPFETRIAQEQPTGESYSNIQGRLLSPEEGCGFTEKLNTKIVGGVNARPGELKYKISFHK